MLVSAMFGLGTFWNQFDDHELRDLLIKRHPEIYPELLRYASRDAVIHMLEDRRA